MTTRRQCALQSLPAIGASLTLVTAILGGSLERAMSIMKCRLPIPALLPGVCGVAWLFALTIVLSVICNPTVSTETLPMCTSATALPTITGLAIVFYMVGALLVALGAYRVAERHLQNEKRAYSSNGRPHSLHRRIELDRELRLVRVMRACSMLTVSE